MLRKTDHDSRAPHVPSARTGLNWYRLRLKALAAQRSASPYIRGPIAFALSAVLYLLFLVLLWLRPPIQALFRLVGGLTLLALVIGFFVVPAQHKHVLWAIGGTSFATFVLAWCYDWLLLRISPEPIGFFD